MRWKVPTWRTTRPAAHASGCPECRRISRRGFDSSVWRTEPDSGWTRLGPLGMRRWRRWPRRWVPETLMEKPLEETVRSAIDTPRASATFDFDATVVDTLPRGGWTIRHGGPDAAAAAAARMQLAGRPSDPLSANSTGQEPTDFPMMPRRPSRASATTSDSSKRSMVSFHTTPAKRLDGLRGRLGRK